MSFDYNPYNHVEVVHRPHGNVKLYCHSCRKLWGDWVPAVPVIQLFRAMANHVSGSHGYTRADMADWSDL